jgi:hypothetical protein
MNTKTTGDGALIKGLSGMLVIINGEKNILLTCKYRFMRLVGTIGDGSGCSETKNRL